MRAALRRTRDLATSLPGRNDLLIADLIVPYRLDIVVRRRMIERLVEASAPTSEEALLDWATDTGYAAWFDLVEVARFRRDLQTDTKAARAALLTRIHGLQNLLQSIDESNGTLSKRLVLDWHVFGATSETGIADAYPVAPADGCHRIAALSQRGIKTLRSTEHRRRIRLGSAILDNTTRLLTSPRFSADEVVELFALEHAGFRASLAGDDHPRAREFTEWTQRIL